MGWHYGSVVRPQNYRPPCHIRCYFCRILGGRIHDARHSYGATSSCFESICRWIHALRLLNERWNDERCVLHLDMGAQTANLASQTVLPRSDVALGTAMMFFVQQLGGSIFLAVGQNIFSRDLIKKLSGITGLNSHTIVNTGATDLRRVVPANEI